MKKFYIAYVSEQNLLDDLKNGPANHPDIRKIFSHFMETATFHMRM